MGIPGLNTTPSSTRVFFVLSCFAFGLVFSMGNTLCVWSGEECNPLTNDLFQGIVTRAPEEE